MDDAYKRALEKIEEAYRTGATWLDLSYRGLSSLPPEIGKLQKLTNLNLSYNQLSSLPSEIGTLQNLTWLHLRSNHLTSLPSEIKKLQNLTYLYLRWNNLMKLPPEIGELRNLTCLSLSSNFLKNLSFEVTKLQNLQELYWSSNQLICLPPEIGRLQKLVSLDLSDNRLSSLPPEIDKLQNLKELYLSANHLTCLPVEIRNLRGLTCLSLSSNQLTHLASEIGSLAHLDSLYLKRNELAHLPSEIGRLKKLTRLDLHGNKLRNLPPEIGKLESLVELYLHSNQLKDVPPEIGKLQNLIKLNLSGNQLKDVPPEMGRLQNLIKLNLSGNQLKDLPPEIAKLQNIAELDLAKNQLKRLPKDIQNLKKFTTNNPDKLWKPRGLQLQGNNFDLPEVVYNKEPQELIQYILNWQQGKNKKPIHEAKVILLGQGYVGKTSLVNRILRDSFNLDEVQTKGIEVSDWAVHRGEDRIDLHLWDFGGQELMHATHRFFMTRRSLYLLVTNPRQDGKYGEPDIDYWMRLIQSYAGEEVPVIVVVNKSDVHKTSVRKRGIFQDYPQVVDIVETSCKTRDGIEELKGLIQEVVGEKLPHIDNRITEAEFRIKEALEEEKRKGIPYLSYFAYTRICMRVDEAINESLTANLLGLLHDLGVMLNFCHGYQTRAETQVLNPVWVTEGVYAIVNAKRLVENRGRLCLEDLRELLDGERYPSEKEHRLILGVMEEFELVYRIGRRNVYLVSGALAEDIPERLNWDLDGGVQLKFRYTYDVLPKSVMSRFIVRMHPFQKEGEGSLWRSGIVLETGGCEALVQAHANQRYIDIVLQGKGNRIRLLAKIHAHFEEIHRSFEAIGVEKEVYVEKRIEGKLRSTWVSYELLLEAEQAGEEEIFVSKLRKIRVKEVLNGFRQHLPIVERDKKVRVVFFASSPADASRLRVDEEYREITGAQRLSSYRDCFQWYYCGAVRTRDLRRSILQDRPKIVHFAGHGKIGLKAAHEHAKRIREAGILLEDGDGRKRFVGGERLKELFKVFEGRVECVFLNCCYSSGVAEVLLPYVPYIVAVKREVEDRHAILFATAFYEGLGEGEGVEWSFDYAKGAEGLEGMGEDMFELFVRGR